MTGTVYGGQVNFTFHISHLLQADLVKGGQGPQVVCSHRQDKHLVIRLRPVRHPLLNPANCFGQAKVLLVRLCLLLQDRKAICICDRAGHRQASARSVLHEMLSCAQASMSRGKLWSRCASSVILACGLLAACLASRLIVLKARRLA